MIRILGIESVGGLELIAWYLDNGESNHISGQRSKFKDLNRSVTGQVNLEMAIKREGFNI